MRTTIDLPDELVREAKIAAVQRGISLKELFGMAIKHELESRCDLRPLHTVDFPIRKSQRPGSVRITDEMIKDAELQDYLRGTGLGG